MKKLLLFLLPFLLLHAADEPGLRDYRIPVQNGEIHSRDLIQSLLEMGGSEVNLPETFPNQTLNVEGPAARFTLFTWNALLREFGVSLKVRDHEVHVRLDLKIFDQKLDLFEEKILRLFRVERAAELIRISDSGTAGPVVVLVHGLDSSRRLFRGTLEVLKQKGYDVYFFEYPNDDKVERNAERFSEALKKLPDDRRQEISLVTVSMGGVISQLMVETPELTLPGIRRLIACVPPFQGSELAALRGVVEIGDHAMSVFFDPKKALDFWGDGMGRAGTDLQPRSLLMDRLDTLQRNPNIHYSILAGNRGIFDPVLLLKTREELAAETSENSVLETARRLTLERLDLILKFQSPQGDGVVTLESAKLTGVTDRVVLPYSHLEFLTGFTASEEIPGLKEVLSRLPPVK